MHVAIGPISPRASWKWLGPHLAESLAEAHTVRFFSDREMPRCDVAIFVKDRPKRALEYAYEYGCRIVYMPVDSYLSREQLDADAPFLGQCSGLLVHSRLLGSFLAGHNAAIWYVDHPNLDGLGERPPYRRDGYVLWVGDFLNLPYLLRWRESAQPSHELKILTNARRTSIGGMAMTLALARRLGVELDLKPDRINGVPVYDWSPEVQRAMMAAAKASLDVKGGKDSFRQLTKPPTKAHQFIASGIPFATNADSSTARDLLESGFEVADVEDEEHWFSHAYWKSTQAFGAVLERRIRPEAVAVAYRRCLEEMTGDGRPGPARSTARAVPAPAPTELEGFAARWRGYARAWRVLRRLGASWEDAAPYFVKTALRLFRDYMPGYVTASVLDARGHRPPVAASVLVDLSGRAGANGLSELQAAIPDAWELVGRRALRAAGRAGVRITSISRWPRRGLLRDRLLASGYAGGRYLAFAPRLATDEVTWIQKALDALETRPQTALLRRASGAGTGDDGAPLLVVRRDVWLALEGYDAGPSIASPRCGEIELLQRVRLLGYEAETVLEPRPEPLNGARARPRSGGEIVVYTAVTNCYDRLLPLDERRVRPARQVAFLDSATRSATPTPWNWEIREIDWHEQDPNRRAKLAKIRPELFFPDAEYSLWIDGNVSLVYPFDIHRLIDLFLAEADLCLVPHFARSCSYQEAEACKERRLDSASLIDRQMASYRDEGFPEWYGLDQAVVILRRHSEAVEEFDRRWWDEIERGSRRDQLSLNYALWKTELPVAEFPLPIQDKNGLFVKGPHAHRRPLRKPAARDFRALARRAKAFHAGSMRLPSS